MTSPISGPIGAPVSSYERIEYNGEIPDGLDFDDITVKIKQLLSKWKKQPLSENLPASKTSAGTSTKPPVNESPLISKRIAGTVTMLNGFANLAQKYGNHKLASRFDKTSKGIEATAMIKDNTSQLKRMLPNSEGKPTLAMIGQVGSIIGAATAIISLFAPEERDIAGERHEQVMDALHQIHDNIVSAVSEHHDAMMTCFEKLAEHHHYNFTIQQQMTLNGFSAMLTEQHRTRGALEQHYSETQKKLERLVSTHTASFEAQKGHLNHIAQQLPDHEGDLLKAELSSIAEMLELSSLDQNPLEYFKLFNQLGNIALMRSTQALLTGSKVFPGSDDLVESNLKHDSMQNSMQMINLIKNILNIEGNDLPNVAFWIAAVTLLERAVTHRLDKNLSLEKDHHLSQLNDVLIQGKELNEFLEKLSSADILSRLFDNYQKRLENLLQAVKDEVKKFDEGVVKTLRSNVEKHWAKDNEKFTSYNFNVTDKRVSPVFHNITAQKKSDMYRDISNLRNEFDQRGRAPAHGAKWMAWMFDGSVPYDHDYIKYHLQDQYQPFITFEHELHGGDAGRIRCNWAANSVMAIVAVQKRAEGIAGYSANSNEELGFVRRWLNNYHSPKYVVKADQIQEDRSGKLAAFMKYKKKCTEELSARRVAISKSRNSSVLGTCKPADREETALIHGTEVPLPILRFGSLCPRNASSQVKKQWELALKAEALGAGEIEHRYSLDPTLTIDTTLRVGDTSIGIAKWSVPTFTGAVASCYEAAEKLWYFWDNPGLHYQKPFNPATLPKNDSSTNSGYGVHSPIDIASLQEVPSNDTTKQLEAVIQSKIRERRQELKNTLINEFNNPGTPLNQSRQKLNVAYRLLRSVLLLSMPEECGYDPVKRLLSDKGFIREGDDAASLLFEWEVDGKFLDRSLEASLVRSQQLYKSILDARRANKLILGIKKFRETYQSLYVLIERFKAHKSAETSTTSSSEKQPPSPSNLNDPVLLNKKIDQLTTNVNKLTATVGQLTVIVDQSNATIAALADQIAQMQLKLQKLK